MNIVNVEPRKLKPAIYNPRKISAKQMEDLKKSIKEFWLVEPVIVNNLKGREWIIVGWHQRFEAMKQLWYTEIPVVYVTLTETKEKALNIALNKITWEFDFGKLQEVLADIAQNTEDFDATLTGFTNEDIEMALTDIDEMMDRHDKAKMLKDNMMKSWINPDEAQVISDIFEHSKEVAKEDVKDVKFCWEIKQRYLINFWIDDETEYEWLKQVYWTWIDIEQDVEKLKNITRESLKYNSNSIIAVTKRYEDNYLSDKE